MDVTQFKWKRFVCVICIYQSLLGSLCYGYIRDCIIYRPAHREERFEEEVLEEDEAEVNLSKLDEEILEVY